MKVKKYGGSSVKNEVLIKKVAQSISEDQDKQLVVVSAKEGFTSEVIRLARSISSYPNKREVDQMIVAGEMLNASLLALALQELGVKAISKNALSLGIYATGDYGDGKIESIDKEEVLRLFEKYDVIVVTGFQGIKGTDFVSLGRGGSDTTALALASVFDTKCYIYTDVDGVVTIDPRLGFNGKCLDELSYQDMLELSLAGSKVLCAKASQIAFDKKVDTYVLRSLTKTGTKISSIESYGIKAIQVKDNVEISSNIKDCLTYSIIGSEVIGIKETKKSDKSLISLVGSFLITEENDKKLLNLLKSLNIEYEYYIVRENIIYFVIPTHIKDNVIRSIMKEFDL